MKNHKMDLYHTANALIPIHTENKITSAQFIFWYIQYCSQKFGDFH